MMPTILEIVCQPRSDDEGLVECCTCQWKRQTETNSPYSINKHPHPIRAWDLQAVRDNLNVQADIAVHYGTFTLSLLKDNGN
jgi:hypothetical protein